jgi:hypothetical protein
MADETAPGPVRDKSGREWAKGQLPKYEALSVLAPNATGIAVSVPAKGCATLKVELAARPVVLCEIATQRRP